MMALTDEPPEEFQDDETSNGSARTSPDPPLASPSPVERMAPSRPSRPSRSSRSSIETPPMELDPRNLKVDPENSKLLQAVQKQGKQTPPIQKIGAFSPRNFINQIR